MRRMLSKVSYLSFLLMSESLYSGRCISHRIQQPGVDEEHEVCQQKSGLIGYPRQQRTLKQNLVQYLPSDRDLGVKRVARKWYVPVSSSLLSSSELSLTSVSPSLLSSPKDFASRLDRRILEPLAPFTMRGPVVGDVDPVLPFSVLALGGRTCCDKLLVTWIGLT